MAQDTVAERIRERAHQIWLEQGRPDGKQQELLEKARQEIEAAAEKKMMENQRR